MKGMCRIIIMLYVMLIAQFARTDGNGQPAKANILFLSIDDLKPELSCYGSKTVQSPNIDKLAARGMLFGRHYIQEAICAPSRVSMFCGLRPDTTRVWDLKHTCKEQCPKAFTMQEYFKKNGYITAGTGKIMHGFKNDDPASWSIPYVHESKLAYAGGRIPALMKYQSPKIHAAVREMEKLHIKGYSQQNKWMSRHGAMPPIECLDVPDNAYPDGAIAEWGMNMLEKFSRDQKPFFLTLGFKKPHLPFAAPKKYWDLFDRDKIELAAFRERAKGSPDFAYSSWGELRNYSDIPKEYSVNLTPEQQKEMIHGYYACVAYIDAQVGKVLRKLRETGLDKNTIVVLWGDHGWHLGDHGLWCKHTNFEQATHSPLIISAPGFPAAVKSDALVESVDIFPTLCELTGLPVPKQLEGTSLVAILKNPKTRVKEFAISQYPRSHKKYMGYALRTDRYRLVMWMKNDFRSTQPFDESLVAAVELYDYKKDPLETINVAGNPEYRETVRELRNKMIDWFRQHQR